ncbi:MAG: hypothetical protein P8Y66_07105 [Nitrospirota bacterium]|jgi:hypothetical protein
MSLRSLAESVIFQAIEDLHDGEHRHEALAFFQGDTFREWARMAGMSRGEKLRLLEMISAYLHLRPAGGPTAQTVSFLARKAYMEDWRHPGHSV